MIKNLTDLTVRPDASLLDTIAAISKGTKQIALVIDDAGVLLGTVTDGDVRRGELAGAVEVLGGGRDLLLRDPAGHVLDHQLLFGESEVHGRSSGDMRERRQL